MTEPWRKEDWARAAASFADEEVEIHPKGLIYLPHERLRTRLNDAFGPGFYRFVPVGDPVAGNTEVIWRFRLSFRDGTEAEAAGHAAFIRNNPSYSYGDALETCNSDAFARCCKSAGIGLQVWNRDYQIYFMQKYAVNVPLLTPGKTAWRRRDRPALSNERRSERQQGPDYVPRETLDHENRKHFDSIKPKRGSAWDDSGWSGLTKDEHFAPEADADEARQLHELEEAAFADDAREDG